MSLKILNRIEQTAARHMSDHAALLDKGLISQDDWQERAMLLADIAARAAILKAKQTAKEDAE